MFYHSESGILNCGPLAEEGEEDINLINAGGQFLESVPGMAFFDSSHAFAMIRGGHVDVTVLGSHQVSAKGDLANWMLPQRGRGKRGRRHGPRCRSQWRHRGYGTHRPSDTTPRSSRNVLFPVTGQGCVYLIVTDLAVIERADDGLVLLKKWPPAGPPKKSRP